jgi:serine/threonine protein kinase
MEKKSPKFPPKADVWSFAMVCSEILTGQPPFASEPRATLHAKIVNEGVRPQLPENCPDYLCFCITHCWELSEKKRPDFSSICRYLMLAKTKSLGIIPFDISNHLFSDLNEIEKRSNVGPSLPNENTNFSLEQTSSSGEMGDHQDDG